jgi:hypothetical protein
MISGRNDSLTGYIIIVAGNPKMMFLAPSRRMCHVESHFSSIQSVAQVQGVTLRPDNILCISSDNL